MRILLFLFLFSSSILVSMEQDKFTKARRSSRSLPAVKPAEEDEQSPVDSLDRAKQPFTIGLNAVGVMVVKFIGAQPHTYYRAK